MRYELSTNEVQQLDEDVLGLIFDAACRGDTGMVAILGSVCKQFRRLVVSIADETVVIYDYVLDDPGPAITPEMALKVFGQGGDERKRLRARSLKWKAYNVRLGVLAQVLGTLERVTALTFIGATLNQRTDIILHLPKIREIIFRRCTLGFSVLANFMQALPNLQALRILGPGMIISKPSPFFPGSEPALILPSSLESLDMDCSHMWGHFGVDDGERILYWFRNAKNLVWLKLAMTGEVGWLPGNSMIQVNSRSLSSLSLSLGVSLPDCVMTFRSWAVEHPKQCWDYDLKVEAPELLDLTVSVRSTPIDLYFINDFFRQLQSPKLSNLALHIHVISVNDSYSAGETVSRLKNLAECIIHRSVDNRLQELTVRWHSYQDTVAIERYSPALQASFDVSASHDGIKMVTKQTNHPHEMF